MANVLVVLEVVDVSEVVVIDVSEVVDVSEMVEVVVWVMVELEIKAEEEEFKAKGEGIKTKEEGDEAEEEKDEDKNSAEDDAADIGETVTVVGAGWITRQAISTASCRNPKSSPVASSCIGREMLTSCLAIVCRHIRRTTASGILRRAAGVRSSQVVEDLMRMATLMERSRSG